VFTTSATYPWSFLTHIFHNGQQSHGGDRKTFERDDSNFPIVNFPFICGNIPAAPAYGVYISQLIRYFGDCGSYMDFLDRGLLLTRKLLNRRFLLVKLKSSLQMFYDRHHDFVDHYGIYVSEMTKDMLHLS
jgi:hypothetical protein